MPRVHIASDRGTSDGDLAAAFASAYNLAPDPWQQIVLDDWLRSYGGRWSHLTAGVSVPRQNGKNALLEIRELYGMVALGERILHTAHEVKTAQKHFRRLKYFFGSQAEDASAQFPELNALVKQVRSVNGQEAIFLENGGSIELVARSKNSGRGFTVDVLVMDEAQELSEDALEALMPTTSAAPLGNPQWIFTGTPPGPNAVGEVFTRVRREALGEKPGRLCWHEWSVTHGADLDDRTNWRMTNPALDAGRLQVEVIEGERARFSDEGFARERLGLWASDDGSRRFIPAVLWDGCAVDSVPGDGVRSIGVAFSHDGARVSTCGALKHDGGVHVELIAAYSGPTASGVGELASWLAERWQKFAMVAVAGAAGSALVQALRDRGVPSRVVHAVSTPEYFAANAMIDEALRSGTVTHPVGADGDVLDASVAVCDRRLRGSSGQWGWEATTPDGDETPIEAFSVAHWAARTAKRRPGRKQVLI